MTRRLQIFRKEMQCVQDVCVYLVLVSFATGVYGCRRECGATELCWREGGREGGGRGVRPFPFSTENSHIVAYSLPVALRHTAVGNGDLNVIGVLNVPVHCLPNVPPNVTPI